MRPVGGANLLLSTSCENDFHTCDCELRFREKHRSHDHRTRRTLRTKYTTVPFRKILPKPRTPKKHSDFDGTRLRSGAEPVALFVYVEPNRQTDKTEEHMGSRRNHVRNKPQPLTPPADQPTNRHAFDTTQTLRVHRHVLNPKPKHTT